MGSASQPRQRRALQRLLLKHFGMAAATCGLGMLLFWLHVLGGDYRSSLSSAWLYTLFMASGQLLLFGLFASGHNRHFRDASLTEAQVLLALGGQTYVVSQLDAGRGSMLVMYLIILLFSVFQLPPRTFIRCATLAFGGFAGVNLWQAWPALDMPSQAWLQLATLFLVLFWLCLFCVYVHTMRQRIRQRRVALQSHQDTLRGMMRQLEDLAATDELTGLFNRRHFLHLAEHHLGSLRDRQCHGLALIDLDHFKRVNDCHGHATGDLVLRDFARVARLCLRDGDILARYGGEEFVVLLPNTEARQFHACCERLRQAFADSGSSGLPREQLSLSVGMTLLRDGDALDAALQRADQALYRAKRNGRNRCEALWEEALA